MKSSINCTFIVDILPSHLHRYLIFYHPWIWKYKVDLWWYSFLTLLLIKHWLISKMKKSGGNMFFFIRKWQHLCFCSCFFIFSWTLKFDVLPKLNINILKLPSSCSKFRVSVACIIVYSNQNRFNTSFKFTFFPIFLVFLRHFPNSIRIFKKPTQTLEQIQAYH